MLCTLTQMFHHSIAVILTTALYFLPERQRAEKANGVRFSSQALYFETRFGSWHLLSSRAMSAGCCCQQKKVFRQAAMVPLQLVVLLPSHVTGQNNLSRSSGTQLSLDTVAHVEGKTKRASYALIKQNCPTLPPDSMPPSRDTLDMLPTLDMAHPGQWSSAAPAQRELRASLKATQHIIRGLSHPSKPKPGFCVPQSRERCGYPRAGFTPTEPGWEVIQPALRGVVSR